MAKFIAQVCTARPQLRELVFSSDFDNLWKLKQVGQLPESKLCPSIRGLGAGPFVVEVVAAAKLSAVKECDL